MRAFVQRLETVRHATKKTFVARGWIANPIEISRTGDPINRARAIAGQLPIFNGIPFEANQLDAPAILSINDNNARIQEALARCRALLAIREKLHTNGGFQPQAFAK